MRFRFFACMSLVLILGLIGPSAYAEFRVESLDNDYPDEIQSAVAEGKNLVLFFHQAGCPYCDKMRARVLPSKKIYDYFNQHFVMIESNIRGNLDVVMHDGTQGTERELARKLRVRATPVFVFFDEHGEVALRTTGFLDVEQFYLAGKYVTDEVYKSKKSFFRYIQDQQ